MRAQRLSASQRSASRAAGNARVTTVTCSTPFGITEVGMSASGASAVPASPGAQRLSASQRWAYAYLVAGTSDNSWGAQRLSASQRWACRIARTGSTRRVMCSTPFGITEVGIQSWQIGMRMTRQQCSTPFGITEVGMRSPDRRIGRAQTVLNAFRHHRGGHASRPEAERRHVGCSTPFGITEVGMRFER